MTALATAPPIRTAMRRTWSTAVAAYTLLIAAVAASLR
jgi:hypothetical protein